MNTVRELLRQLEAGVKPLDQVIVELRNGDWPRPAPPATDDLETIVRADDIAGDNDVYWIDEAFSSHTVDEDTYLMLRDAIRSSWRIS